mgnify:FL=1
MKTGKKSEEKPLRKNGKAIMGRFSNNNNIERPDWAAHYGTLYYRRFRRLIVVGCCIPALAGNDGRRYMRPTVMPTHDSPAGAETLPCVF